MVNIGSGYVQRHGCARGEEGRSAEDWVSKNLRKRSQADTDFCTGLFDTRAGPIARVSRLS